MPRQAIFFLIDTQGVDCVGCYAGLPGLGTPHLDRLAVQGVRFNAAYTCVPVCGPARSAIFTGLYPHSNGVLGNDLSPHLDIPTLGQRLSKAGIRAGYIGKWHLDGTDYFGDGRCPPGWDPACVFDGRHKLAVNLLDLDEFYDLADDPAELDNRVNDPACAAARDRLHDALLDWMNRTRDPLRGPHWGRRPWREVPASTWGGPMRPRPFDTAFSPRTLLYTTGRVIEKPVYSRKELLEGGDASSPAKPS